MMSLCKCEVKERSVLVRVGHLFLILWIRSHRMRTKPRAHTATINSCVILVNGKRKNYLVKQVYDGNATKVSDHNKQACNMPICLELKQKRIKLVPLQMHTGQSVGKQVKAMSVCRDDLSTVGMQSVSGNPIQYWSKIDEFMESGDLLDLCGNE